MPDDISVGRSVRAVRLTKNLRQVDVAARAGVSAQTISRLERGLVEDMGVGSLRAISRALDMPWIVLLGWRGPEMDQLRDRSHARMVEGFAARLEALGWRLAPENSFNRFGERGSADILAWHGTERALLIVECKTRIWDLQDLLFSLDRKKRLLPAEVVRRWNWRPSSIGVVLVLPELSTNRHVVERHATTFRAALPQRQREVDEWLALPAGNLAGIRFLPYSPESRIEQRVLRIRASSERGRGRKARVQPRKSG